jgi:hypothetical protein
MDKKQVSLKVQEEVVTRGAYAISPKFCYHDYLQDQFPELEPIAGMDSDMIV